MKIILKAKSVKIKRNFTQNMDSDCPEILCLKRQHRRDLCGHKQNTPETGRFRKRKGHVQEGFTIGPAQFIVIIEDGEKG